MVRLSLAMVVGCLLFLGGSTVEAQSLVWNLPADGTWARYTGTYKQVESRPDDAAGNLEIPEWTEQVTIKSVGTEEAEIDGKTEPARWLEFVIERGREVDGKLDTGITGREIYKVLVAETNVPRQVIDDEGVPVSFLKVIKGYRRIGDGKVVELAAPALQLYPLALAGGYYRETEEGGAEEVETPAGQISATKIAGQLTVERAASRTVEESTVWQSPDSPFGVVAWTATLKREVKDERASRDDFKTLTEVTSSLKLAEKGEDAKSDLPDSK